LSLGTILTARNTSHYLGKLTEKNNNKQSLLNQACEGKVTPVTGRGGSHIFSGKSAQRWR
jgi:hypothetical protein